MCLKDIYVNMKNNKSPKILFSLLIIQELCFTITVKSASLFSSIFFAHLNVAFLTYKCITSGTISSTNTTPNGFYSCNAHGNESVKCMTSPFPGRDLKVGVGEFLLQG